MPRISQPVPIPSPYGGINTREGIGSLQPHEARSLVNWNPEGNALKPRNGFAAYSTGAPSGEAVNTLAAYTGISGHNMIGVTADGSIWDFSNATATIVSAAAYTESLWQTDVYNNYLFAVNGADTPWRYSASAVSATGFSGSGLTLTDLVNVRKARQRLWFCENDSADVWYGGIGSITGTLTKFQLSQVAGGGYCMAVGSHSQDAGDGPDDYICFVMSTGECLLYSGDPGSSFSKVGNFFMPPPVGRHCVCNIGGGLVVMTHGGLVPIEAAVTGAAFDYTSLGNFGKYAPSLKRDVDLYGMNDGWHMVYHESKVIINVPTDPGVTSVQRVFNTLTGTWTTWEGINASTLCVYNTGDLFFGGIDDGKVFEVTGHHDAGQPIAVSSRGAFVVVPGGLKSKVTAARFDMVIDGAISGQFGLDTDYRTIDLTTYPTIDIASSTASTPWGSAWGSDWSDSSQYPGQWLGAYADGHSAAITMEAEVLASEMEWLGSHLLIRQIGI